MASNGQLPASSLRPIAGSSPNPGGKPLLRWDAASAWNAMDREARRRFGVSMAIHERSLRRAYRPLSAQWAAYRTYGSRRAAYPGTSNHGWGLAVDLMSYAQRNVINRIGHKYGFTKGCSDASHEWWHVKYNPRCTGATFRPTRTSSSPTLRRGMTGNSVVTLKKLLYSKGYRNFSGTPENPSSNRYNKFFGLNTERTVKRFQRRRGLTADGVVGPSTWRALRR